mgnify:CR=1 FL=1
MPESKGFRWFIKFPLDAYALGPSPDYFETEQKAREYYRNWDHLKRLPRGTELWKADPREYPLRR